MRKALIVLGGGDGSFSATQKIAETIAKSGLVTFAAAYFKQPGLPEILKSVPLEYLEKITLFLRDRGYEKIGLWGISMGAEYVLLAGSLMPELYSCVIAASPIFFATQGVVSFTKMADGAAFSFRGKDVSYQRFQQAGDEDEYDSGKVLKSYKGLSAGMNRMTMIALNKWRKSHGAANHGDDKEVRMEA